MTQQALLCERRQAIAILTLNRPAKRNAIDFALGEALIEAIRTLDADDAIRVLVLTGSGEQAFCAGADMGEALVQGSETSSTSAAGRSDAIAGMLVNVRKPVIAAINGYAYGLGAQLAIGADLRVASTRAKFRFLGTAYGLVVSGA